MPKNSEDKIREALDILIDEYDVAPSTLSSGFQYLAGWFASAKQKKLVKLVKSHCERRMK